MIKKAQRAEMLDYIVANLEASNEDVRPNTKRILKAKDIDTSYIRVGENGLVILIDQPYTMMKNGERKMLLNPLYNSARKQELKPAFVFYKDGETFFRSAAESKRFKKDKRFSLKDYTDKQINNMILFRPEEEFVLNHRNGFIQYYQPESERLEQGIRTFKFVPVVYDYSHIPSGERFSGNSRDSDKLRMWTRDNLAIDNLKIKNGFLKSC